VPAKKTHLPAREDHVRCRADHALTRVKRAPARKIYSQVRVGHILAHDNLFQY